MMNNDILRKLIELACNNPNEAEANSAARKVCRMIKDDNFAILNGSVFSPPRPTQRTRPSPEDILRDIQRAAAEAQAREAARTKKAQEDWERINRERVARDQERARQRAKYANTDYGTTIREMICNDCKETKKTTFVGHDSLFVCSSCKVIRDRKRRGV